MKAREAVLEMVNAPASKEMEPRCENVPLSPLTESPFQTYWVGFAWGVQEKMPVDALYCKKLVAEQVVRPEPKVADAEEKPDTSRLEEIDARPMREMYAESLVSVVNLPVPAYSAASGFCRRPVTVPTIVRPDERARPA